MIYKKIFLNSIEGLLIFIILISGILVSCRQRKSELTNIAEGNSIIKIPVVSGPLKIDGKLDDVIWQSAFPLSLKNEDNTIIRVGGNTKIAIRGEYLCLSAQIAESGKIIVHSTGNNPSWWREDMILWMFRYQSPFTHANKVALFAVNPFGAYNIGSVRDIYNITHDDIFTSVPLEWSDDILVAAEIGHNEWSVEAALPLKQLGITGFISVERIRVPRVNTPEMRWYWPAPYEQVAFESAGSNTQPKPLIQKPNLPNNNVGTSIIIPVNELAAKVKALPKEAWSHEEQDSLGVRKMLEKSIRARMAALAEKEKLAWQEVKTVYDWELFRNERYTSLLNLIGPMPERTPLKSVVTRRINYGEKFVIENIVYESRPDLIVTANLYLPEKISGKIPAIIVIHSHHKPKTQTELQDMGMTWARARTAVLIMDQLCAGERIQTQPWLKESYYGRYALGNQLYLAGESLIKWMVWDIIRGIDLLTERSYIDPKRIVLMGAVAGGGDPAALTANFDKRIAAVIPFNFGEAGPEEYYTEAPRWYDFETADPGWAYWETTRSIPNSVSEKFLDWFICAAIAPRNFIFSIEIGWPKTVEDEPAWIRYKKVYDFYGAHDHLASVEGFGPFPGISECYNVGTFQRKSIYPILNRWFGMEVPKSEYHDVFPESALMCLTPSSIVGRTLKPASLIALEHVKKHLAESRMKYNGLTSSERINTLRLNLRQKLGDIEPVDVSLAHKIWTKQSSDLLVEAFYIETEPGIKLPFFLLTPKNNSNHQPAVIGLAEGGKKGFLSQRPNEIAFLLSKGTIVCLPDLRGKGPVEQRQAEPLGPFLSLLTALYEDRVVAIACRGGLVSFSSVLEDNFCHIPQDVVVPGLLEITDIVDIVRTIAPRPVLLAEPVNGT